MLCFEVVTQTPRIDNSCDFGHLSIGKVHLSCDDTGHGYSWQAEGNFQSLLYCPFCGKLLESMSPTEGKDKSADSRRVY